MLKRDKDLQEGAAVMVTLFVTSVNHLDYDHSGVLLFR
jgi:hypothetical protein